MYFRTLKPIEYIATTGKLVRSPAGVIVDIRRRIDEKKLKASNSIIDIDDNELDVDRDQVIKTHKGENDSTIEDEKQSDKNENKKVIGKSPSQKCAEDEIEIGTVVRINIENKILVGEVKSIYKDGTYKVVCSNDEKSFRKAKLNQIEGIVC